MGRGNQQFRRLCMIFVFAFISLFTLSGCDDDPPATPLRVTTAPAAANTPVATLFSPLVVVTATPFVSPLAKVAQTTQITVPDAYTGAYSYRITYPTEEWRVDNKMILERIEPELVHLTVDGCHMRLRDGPRGQSPDTIIVHKTMAGLNWSIYTGGRRYAFYILYLPDKNISFFIRLEVPKEASGEVRAACQRAAEMVLDTFSIVAAKEATDDVTPIETAQIVRADQLPPVSHDLIFISDGYLRQWNHQTGQIETLLGSETMGFVGRQNNVSFLFGPGSPTGAVLEFSSAGGVQLAVVTFQRGAAGIPSSNNVLLYNRETGQQIPLTADDGQVTLPSISPDGEWIAWVLLEDGFYARRPPGLAAPLPQSADEHDLPFGHVYVAPTTSPSESRLVGSCGSARQATLKPCTQLFWSADSRQLVWQNRGTVWHISRTNATPPIQSLLPAGSGELQALSPSGRYLLTKVLGHTEGSELAVVDPRSGRMMAIGGSFEYVLPGARVLWLDDDRLLVAHHASLFGSPADQTQPLSEAVIEIWRMADPPHDLLQLEQRVSIPARVGTFVGGQRQIDHQHIALALLNPDAASQQGAGLFLFDLTTGTVHKLRNLPPMGQWDETASARNFPEGLYWLPDASGLIIQDAGNQTILYAPAEGNSVFDIGNLLGQQACCFTWVTSAVNKTSTNRFAPMVTVTLFLRIA